ncbi:unnamed protein product [Blepharisma stoltei]|uniref:Restriction endonuclease n=1 Tax=Blepharisma stoltei TaxID=1481888 RepID=A0AAU9J5A4_9CILI|nr:unnamed protein product [Blepharisma stoltei]
MIVDILSNGFNISSFSNIEEITLLVPEDFIITDNIRSVFKTSSNFDECLDSQKSYFRVSSEFQRGVLIGRAISLKPDLIICTSRPEIFKKYLPKIHFQNYEEIQKNSSKDAGSQEEVLKSIESKLSSQLKQVDYKTPLEKLYQEVLNKFVETFFQGNGIPAGKVKSLKSQIRNLAEGAVISARKKSQNKDQIPTSFEISEIIYEDFVKYGIVEDQGVQVYYNRDEIDAYFGEQKYKTFTPACKASLNLEDKENVEIPPKRFTFETVQKCISAIIPELDMQNPKELGEVVNIILDFVASNSKIAEPDRQQAFLAIFKFLYHAEVITFKEDIPLDLILHDTKSYLNIEVDIKCSI